ncbi:DNA sulfur modification protein DndB [Nodularia spumigena CS-591/12]|uniref:DNA sulfur modification protein DndB n=1 Tax=Nodularia spumigena TaxID=70799 RepID=UPI00232D2F4C|nr:DNA sulfur modification protein DndB [Nodularia spumigena]MDB9305701.1 DNA sulfur modification protein DndB [Nodularia spumigena CS-591/12]MDB9344200.1 DNA sulfur modification protein DndB [Nodularia spumigena CS-588/06]MDB9370502.1 DNA sulfur modification protein DndB [Nodularia spumigena CS-586/05]
MTETSQDSNNHISPDIKATFSTLVAPLFDEHYLESCYPGLIFHQGKRKMLQINVPAKDLPTLLQAKPSTKNDPDSGKNRPEVKGHAKEIKDYVVERAKANKPWVLGTITANVDEQHIKVHELGRGICIVVIPNGIKLDITDGQHRKTAIHELIFSDESHLIAPNQFAITLILEGNQRQCQTDFRDMAQTKQLDNSLLLSFGEFEGRVGITKNLIERVRMFQEKTNKIGRNAPTKQRLIYTTNFIARFVSCIFADEPNNDLQGLNVEELSEALAECLNNFFSECADTKNISETKHDKLTVSQVAAFKEYSLLGVSVGLEVLGRLLYLTYDQDRNYFDLHKVSQLAQLDWSRKNNLWENNVVRKSSNSDTKAYEVVNKPTPILDAVKTVKSTLGWM